MSFLLALDAGHGMSTSGKRCNASLDPNQTREWWLNDRIADGLQARLLAKYDCEVLRTDDTTGAKDISLANRVKSANTAKADAFLSIHHNAGANCTKSGGVVVFYCSSKAERATQAKALYDAVVAANGLVGNRSSKVINKGYYVIKNTNMPAFLIENGFMDSTSDTPIILTQAHAEKTIDGLEKFLVNTFGLKAKTVPDVPVATPSTNASSGSTGSSGCSCGCMCCGKSTDVYYPSYTGTKTTLIDALNSLGIDSSYSHRKEIAVYNGITTYRGTAQQNTQVYNWLVAGLLKKPV